jgi:hypothetical protein
MKVQSARRLSFVPACVISAAAVAAMVAPSAASAGVQCSGANITGQGAAVEGVAQGVWTANFNTSTDAKACSGKQGNKAKPTVTYNSTSSGAGLRSWGAEDKSPTEINFGPGNAFFATAEAPNATQQTDIQSQESTSTPDTIETLPVTQYALTVYVNLPTGCTATSTGASGRLVLSDKTLEAIWNGTIKEWGEITDDGDAITGSGCATDPIVPVVRKEKAGTTNTLKKYLGLINKGTLSTSKGPESWDALSEGSLNVVWPTALAPTLTTAEGDAAEADKVASIPGSIGYSNLAELRVLNLFSGTGNGAGTAKFWVEIQNGTKGKGASLKNTYQDPSSNGDSGTAASANCKDTAYTNGESSFPPPAVTALWNEVTTSITKPEKTYSLCNFAYDVVSTKYSLLSGTSEAEAQAVHDYFGFVADKKGGQKLLAGNDYYGVPKEVAAELVSGAAAIGY